MFKTTLSRPELDGSGLKALEQRWREFAAESGASFFQDWTWVGCRAAERYGDPVLLEMQRDGKLVGLALFDRRSSRHEGDTLRLQESTDPVLASIFTEHNGPLVSITDPVLRQAVLAELLTTAMYAPVSSAKPRPRRLMLSGVAPDCAAASVLTGGMVDESSTRMAPYVDFSLLESEQPFVERLSRNTRHQLRRSNRHYATEGTLALRRADTVEEGLLYFADMVKFHDHTWTARGKAGAFATPGVRHFYQALISEGLPSGEVDMLKVTAGPTIVGYLMNFNHRGIVSAYQSGFNYADAGPHQKPGLTCHYLAIESYRSNGVNVYDFLAGADRYKLSLANAQRWLHWLSAAPPWHPQAVGARIKRMLQI